MSDGPWFSARPKSYGRLPADREIYPYRTWFEARMPVDLAIVLQNITDVHASLGPDAQYRLREAIRSLLSDDFREGT